MNAVEVALHELVAALPFGSKTAAWFATLLVPLPHTRTSLPVHTALASSSGPSLESDRVCHRSRPGSNTAPSPGARIGPEGPVSAAPWFNATNALPVHTTGPEWVATRLPGALPQVAVVGS